MSLRRFADVHRDDSYSNRNRARRFARFESLLSAIEEPVRILDVGGTNSFWEQRGYAGRDEVRIFTANISAEEQLHSNITPIEMDASHLDFADDSFDIVFSNSVIEHLRTRDAQEAMAGEVRRLAPRYWVQTPNYWFPVEPHFLTPGWQYLPEDVRVWLLRRRRFGWRGPCPDRARARDLVREVRLLRRREIVEMFPDAELITERFGPLAKSFVAVRA